MCNYILFPPPPHAPPHSEADLISSTPTYLPDREWFPFTHTPRVLLKYDMSHHFAFIIRHLQWSQEKLVLRVLKVKSLGMLTTSENPAELPRWAAGHQPKELVPRLCRCVALGIHKLGCRNMCQSLPPWWHGRWRRHWARWLHESLPPWLHCSSLWHHNRGSGWAPELVPICGKDS